MLVLSADPHSSPGLLDLELALRRVLTDSTWNAIDIEIEHLDLVYDVSPGYHRTLVDLLRVKYANRDPEVVIAVGVGALQFAVAERETLFPHAAILFGHVTKTDLATVPRENIAGVVSEWGFDQEVDLAQRLLPDTRRVVVILGSGPLEQAYEQNFRREFDRFAGKLDIEWWVGRPMAELEQRIAALPPHTVVVFITMYRDNIGGAYVPVIALERLAARSNRPVFGPFLNWIGTGIVGDGHFSHGDVGTQLGNAAMRVLRGESLQSIGVMRAASSPPTFDGRQLERFHISHRSLPPGSRIVFNQPSLWQEHRWMLIVGLSVIVIQALLLAGFVAQRLARRRAEGARRDALELYTAVADSLDERIATLSADGTIVSANRAWAAFAKAHERDSWLVVGSNYVDSVKRAIEHGHEDARRTLDALEAVLSGRGTSRRIEYFSAGDHERWRYDMRVVAFQRPGGGAVVTIGDITDRWRSEERVRVTLESLPIATVLLDTEGSIELVNAEAERLFGYQRRDLLGCRPTMLIPDFALDTVENDRDRLVTGRRKDGGDVPLQLNMRTISMTSRSMTLVSMRDLSDRRRLDAEVQRLREETAHFGRVATVGEMSAAIAHELNQPLTGIMMNCQAAQRLLEHGSFTIADVVETFSDIVADTRRAGEVIQRLRLMLRKQPAEVRPLNLNEIVKQVQRLVAHDLALRGSALDLELAEDLPLIGGDRVHLQQVILNLILNAADAMAGLPPDSRRMVLRTRPGFNQTVELELRDSGPGIPPEAMPHMFQPFFTTKKNGMGMGLSIVRSIVETHGGRITCTNAASGGAVFNVILPASKREAA